MTPEKDCPSAAVPIGWAAWLNCVPIAFGFETLGLPEILAVTTATNLRSQAVMHRIGMTRDAADDFGDPTAPEGPLRSNMLYRIATSVRA